MTGLGEFKTVAREQVALSAEAVRNPKLKQLNRSMIFAGNPGTGKSTCANLLAELAMEKNVGSGIFVSAQRSDMIGKYVGHTAPMIHELFNRARGGILLIDEAGFLIQTGTGEYVKEALKELVRYMELYPDVTVIFAMYPRECRAFLGMDEGLSSRISRVVLFRDYSDEELLEIFQNMASEQGYETDSAAMQQVSSFIGKLRSGAKDSFGNAREMRRLLVQAINSISVRHMQEADSTRKRGRRMMTTGRSNCDTKDPQLNHTDNDKR
jgi:SpoVK/Ycf46/Vps4 family AAA+-type ATPase